MAKLPLFVVCARAMAHGKCAAFAVCLPVLAHDKVVVPVKWL